MRSWRVFVVKSGGGKDKKGRPRTDYYDYNQFIEKDKNYIVESRKFKEYEARKKQAELEGREFTEAPPEDPGPRPQHALWKDAEERFAPDLQTAMQLDEEGLKHHRVVRSEDYQVRFLKILLNISSRLRRRL